MPPKGIRSSAVSTAQPPSKSTLPPKSQRYLRAHSRLSAAQELQTFFSSSPIPNFNEQILEAYVRAIAQEFDSDDAESEGLNMEVGTDGKSIDTDGVNTTDNKVNSDNQPPFKRKIFLTAGLFNEVQHQKKNSKKHNQQNQPPKKVFRFPLPAKNSAILDRSQNFQLPFSVHSSLPKRPLTWKNLKKSEY